MHRKVRHYPPSFTPLSITDSTLPLRPFAVDKAAMHLSKSPLSSSFWGTAVTSFKKKKKAVSELKKSIRMRFMLGPAEKCRAEIYTLFDVRLPAVNW